MTLSKTLAAYGPEIETLDRAAASTRGSRVAMPSSSAAYTFRHRLNKARALERERNCEICNPGDPLYNTSAYDEITICIKQVTGTFFVYLEKRDRIPGVLEDLDNVPEAEFDEVAKPKQITAPSNLRR